MLILTKKNDTRYCAPKRVVSKVVCLMAEKGLPRGVRFEEGASNLGALLSFNRLIELKDPFQRGWSQSLNKTASFLKIREQAMARRVRLDIIEAAKRGQTSYDVYDGPRKRKYLLQKDGTWALEPPHASIMLDKPTAPRYEGSNPPEQTSSQAPPSHRMHEHRARG